MKIVYFAHSIEDYKSLYEKRVLNAIKRILKTDKIVNPAHYRFKAMNFYLNLVRQCDILVWAKRQRDNKITNGVKKELELANQLGIRKIRAESLLGKMYYTFGIARPKGYLFFEIDDKGQFNTLLSEALMRFLYFGIYETKHGYHLVAKCPESRVRKIFDEMKEIFETDYSWFSGMPPVLRFCEKFNAKGKITSPRPKLVYGFPLMEKIQSNRYVYYESEKP
jgi:hypothetical protein